MALKKKSAKQVVEEVVAKVNEELAPATKKEVIEEEDTVLHYYRCNITMDNGKPCNCAAFI